MQHHPCWCYCLHTLQTFAGYMHVLISFVFQRDLPFLHQGVSLGIFGAEKRQVSISPTWKAPAAHTIPCNSVQFSVSERFIPGQCNGIFHEKQPHPAFDCHPCAILCGIICEKWLCHTCMLNALFKLTVSAWLDVPLKMKQLWLMKHQDPMVSLKVMLTFCQVFDMSVWARMMLFGCCLYASCTNFAVSTVLNSFHKACWPHAHEESFSMQKIMICKIAYVWLSCVVAYQEGIQELGLPFAPWRTLWVQFICLMNPGC